jgi:hypothetical protein
VPLRQLRNVTRRFGDVVYLALALVAAGCGGESSAPASDRSIESCLKKEGARVLAIDYEQTGFAPPKPQGAKRFLSALFSSNEVTVFLFSGDPQAAKFERVANRQATAIFGPRADEVLGRRGRAVLIWAGPAPSGLRRRAEGCMTASDWQGRPRH